jgi:hypothetical protein
MAMNLVATGHELSVITIFSILSSIIWTNLPWVIILHKTLAVSSIPHIPYHSYTPMRLQRNKIPTLNKLPSRQPLTMQLHNLLSESLRYCRSILIEQRSNIRILELRRKTLELGIRFLAGRLYTSRRECGEDSS